MRPAATPLPPDPFWLDFTGFVPLAPPEEWPDFIGYVPPVEPEQRPVEAHSVRRSPFPVPR
ncbi:MAG TPA: hypothetical protein VGE86_04615 [Thermoanaerobaculia bacterium]